jgi:RNA polymerase sigma factor (sigma-70 family)
VEVNATDAHLPAPAAALAPDQAVTALYQAHALGLIRLAVVMLGGRRNRAPAALAGDPPVESAEATALIGEEHQQVLTAIRRLPDRQREALVLRFYLDLDEAEIAASMQVSRGTVKSTTSRALAALGRILGEQS